MKTEIEKKADTLEIIIRHCEFQIQHYEGMRSAEVKAAPDLHRDLRMYHDSTVRMATAVIHENASVLVLAGVRKDCPCGPECHLNTWKPELEPLTPAIQAQIAADELRARAEANNPEWFRGSMRSPFFERKHDEY
jgi:hypothetical protein